jgi:ABC-type uncharacterized transport system permease subunit
MNFETRDKIANIANKIIPLICAFVVGAIFCLIIGYNPVEVYGLVINGGFGSFGNLMFTLGFACPIIMTGLATAFSFKAGVWNIGIEGQLYMGAYAAALIGAGYYGMDTIPSYLQIPLALLGGALAGMLYGLIPAVLKAYLNINVVVTTIMMNYIAIALTRFMCKAFHQGNESYDSTFQIMETATIPKIINKYRVTYAIFIALAISMIIIFIVYKTRLGFEISSVGRQFEFSAAVGMRAKSKIMIVFMISGAIAGIAGATEVLGVNKNFMPNFSANPGLGWEGYFVAVLSNNNPIAVIIVAILFGGFRYGSISAQSKIGLPLDLLNIVKSTLILFYAIKYIGGGSKIFNIFKKKKVTNNEEVVA